MSKLVFLGDMNTKYDAAISSIGTNQISLFFAGSVPSDEVVVSGFNVVNEHNGIPQGDYTAYTTIYRKGANNAANEIQLSKDGSTYVAPIGDEIVEPEVSPQYTATIEEAISTKKAEFAASCRKSIENGISLNINGNTENFSYSLEGGDQTNIDDIFNTMLQTGLGQYYHADGGPCKLYTPKQIFNLYRAQKMNKLKHTTQYNQLSMMLRDKFAKLDNTIENRSLILSLTYGAAEDCLDDEYLTLYRSIVKDCEDRFAMMQEAFEAKMAEQNNE